jgi:PAS domain S-box-containing protein
MRTQNNSDLEKQVKKLSLENAHLKKELKSLAVKISEKDVPKEENQITILENTVERLKRQTETLSFLTTHKAIGTGELEKANMLITEASAKTLNVERCSVWLLSADKEKLVCLNLFQASENKHSQGVELKLEDYPKYFNTLLKKAVVSASDAINDISTKEFTNNYLIPLGITSMLDAIIFDEKGIAGVVCFEHIGKKRNWTTDEENFAKIIASLFMRTYAIYDRQNSELNLLQKNEEYEAQNEEYLQLNEELKQAMEELSISKDKLEYNERQINTILGIVDEMLWSQEYGANIPTYISPSVKKVLGREAWEFYNDPELWKKIIHPDDVKDVEKHIKNFQPKRHLELEYRIIHKDKSISWVYDRTNITYDEQNNPIRLDGIVSDITEKKTAEEKSKAQELKINTILKTMPDLLFIIDRDGYYQEVFANNQEELLVPSDKVVGINTIDVFGEKEGKRHIAAFRKCLSTKKMQIIEYEINEKDKTLYFEARLSPLDKNNVLAIVREITERKEFEAKLAHERDLLQYLMDNIPDPIFIKDNKNKYTRVNIAAAEIMGIDHPDKAIDKTAFDFYEKSFAQLVTKEEKNILKTGKPVHGIIDQIKSSKYCYWMLSSIMPIKDKNDNVTGTVGIHRNITQLKDAQEKLELSEELYRMVTENAFDGIYLRNDKFFEYANDRFCEIVGYSKEELYSPDFDFKMLLSKETIAEVELRKLAQRSDVIIPDTYEGFVYSKSGEVKNVEFSTKTISKNKKMLTVGVMRDITVRKRHEELLNEIEIAKKSAVFKQNFLANMSHEIRTPLTGIIGMLEIIDKTNLSVLQKNYLSVLKHSTENLKEIINQVLDFSKIEAGKVALKIKAFDFNILLSNAQKLFSNLCDKDIEFETHFDPNIPNTIKADENRINQIINNLISNAVKFTEKGKITLKTELVEHKEVSRQVVIKIEVIDTGIGIKPENQKHLFKPFSQVDELDTRQHDGTGLGLSICKELVTLHGGEIGVESHYGKGSTFWFTFKAIATYKTLSKAKPENSGFQKAKTKLKILFAEDKAINQKVVKLMLNTMGHEVFMVKNGQEAIKAYKPGKYDLIIMDIQMPVMDGITATKILREKHENLPPIIGLSANAFEGDREKYMGLGLDEYITKPLTSDDFVNLFKDLFHV